jgi:aspartyl-tRNA(Asn)/glutamyl-tRNA(Gln) amidotransferase subunit A
VPKSGCLPLGYTLDHIGPLAGSAADCALMLKIMAGYDDSDLTAIDVPVPDYPSALTGDLSGLRIGVDRLDRFVDAAEDPALPALFEDALSALADRGAEIVPVELPCYVEMSIGVMVILAGEMLAYHMLDAQRRLEDYVASNRLAIGGYAMHSGADYVQAQRVRRAVHRAVTSMFDDLDLIVTPTSSVGAIPFSELSIEVGRWFRNIHTAYWDALGNPVLSVPIGFTDGGLPLAMQIAGRAFDEELVLRAGDAYQRVTDWHRRRPAAVRA